MSSSIQQKARRTVLTAAAAALPIALLGCLDDDVSVEREPGAAELFGEQPFPSTLVGDENFVEALDTATERWGFPEPNPDLLPELTKARFVAEAARGDGDDAFADRLADLREPVVKPLDRYDAVTILVDETRREDLDEKQRERLRSIAGIDEADVSLDDDPQVVVDELLDDRERTFFHYPAPPVHVIEASADRGRDLLDEPPEERAQTVADEHAEYARQRGTVEAVVAGGTDLATEAYEDVAERFREDDRIEWPYDDEEEYAAVVGFNAALAAESMLAKDGELVIPP